MTYETALEVIEKNYHVTLHDFDDETNEYQRKQVEALELAIKAIKKQIAAKLKGEKHYCPSCELAVYKGEYCRSCGQLLDWGSVEA